MPGTTAKGGRMMVEGRFGFGGRAGTDDAKLAAGSAAANLCHLDSRR